MGLDGVEVLVAVEKAFGIEIPNAEAARLVTVGLLEESVLAKIPPAQPGVCLTRTAFYRLRAALVETLGIPREQVRPGSSLDEMIAPHERRRRWEALSAAARLRLPGLVLPRPAVAILLAAVLVVYVTGAVELTKRSFSAGFAAMVMLAPAALLGWTLFHATRPLARATRPGFRTVGGLAMAAARLDYGALATERRAASDREVHRIIRAIIVEETCLDPDLVVPEARFVEDLRFG
jgi:hypothetical protein